VDLGRRLQLCRRWWQQQGAVTAAVRIQATALPLRRCSHWHFMVVAAERLCELAACS